MAQNYFSIERGESSEYLDHFCLLNDNGEIEAEFERLKNMSYDELKEYEYLNNLVIAIMDAANNYFKESDQQTILTLIREDGVFIWSILMGAAENKDDIRYVLVDWFKDGKNYRYEK
jgi:hypothetical protein